MIWLHEMGDAVYAAGFAKQQEAQNGYPGLEKRHRHIAAITSFATKGDLERLSNALNTALEAGAGRQALAEVMEAKRK